MPFDSAPLLHIFLEPFNIHNPDELGSTSGTGVLEVVVILHGSYKIDMSLRSLMYSVLFC